MVIVVRREIIEGVAYHAPTSGAGQLSIDDKPPQESRVSGSDEPQHRTDLQLSNTAAHTNCDWEVVSWFTQSLTGGNEAQIGGRRGRVRNWDWELTALQ